MSFWDGFYKQALSSKPLVLNMGKLNAPMNFAKVENQTETSKENERFFFERHYPDVDHITVRESNGNLVAQACIARFKDKDFDKDTKHLYSLKVEKDYQGRGVGSSVLRRIREEYPDKHLYLRTDPNIGTKNKTQAQLVKFYHLNGAKYLKSNPDEVGSHDFILPSLGKAKV